MTPELRGISRMTNVVSPLAKLGKLTAAGAEAERVRGRPWLTAANWARSTIESNELALPYRTEVKAAAPSFLSAAVAVLLVTGAASALSPIGQDLTGDALPRAGRVDAAGKTPPADSGARVMAGDTDTSRSSFASEDTASPMEQLAAAFAASQAVKGSRLEPTAVALTNTRDAAPRPLLTVAEYRIEPAAVASLYAVELTGLPAGSRVSKGVEVSRGEWVLALEDLDSVEIAVPTSVKRPALAHIEITGQDGVALARFPLVVDPEGHIDTETVASVAVLKDAGQPQRAAKTARLDTPPQPVRAKPQGKLQKDVVATTSPQQQRRKPVAVRPAAAPIIKPTTTANIPIDTAEADTGAVYPIGIMPEGSAGLETFRTFSLLGADQPKP